MICRINCFKLRLNYVRKILIIGRQLKRGTRRLVKIATRDIKSGILFTNSIFFRFLLINSIFVHVPRNGDDNNNLYYEIRALHEGYSSGENISEILIRIETMDFQFNSNIYIPIS